MSDSRFYIPGPPAGEEVVLDGAEASHISRSLRLAAGDSLILFDGEGSEYVAEIVATKRGQVTARVKHSALVSRESEMRLTLAVALPKGDRQRWLVEKATELGVARLILLQTERSVALPGAKPLERCRRYVIEASKQCGRNQLMTVDAMSWDQLLTTYGGDDPRWFADPAGDRLPSYGTDTIPDRLVAAVGPEGGFTDGECAQATANGWQGVSLGARILRIETAALALAARVIL